MRVTKFLLAAAAMSLSAGPVLAAAAAPAKPVIAPASARAADKPGKSKLAGTSLILAAVAAAAAVAGIVAIADGGSNSP